MSQATFRLLASTTHLGSVKSQDTCHIPNFQGTPCWLQRQTVSKVCALSTRCWWSQPGSNRRPPACKAGALPAELWPHRGVRSAAARMVGLGGLEPPASPLSGVRSNHLSYRPNSRSLVWASCRGEVARKEVIQPHLPIRLPCYDFTPVIDHTVVGVLLAVRLPASGAANSHGVTGAITSDSDFMESSCRLQSGLGSAFWDWLHLAVLQPSVPTIVVRV